MSVEDKAREMALDRFITEARDGKRPLDSNCALIARALATIGVSQSRRQCVASVLFHYLTGVVPVLEQLRPSAVASPIEEFLGKKGPYCLLLTDGDVEKLCVVFDDGRRHLFRADREQTWQQWIDANDTMAEFDRLAKTAIPPDYLWAMAPFGLASGDEISETQVLALGDLPLADVQDLEVMGLRHRDKVEEGTDFGISALCIAPRSARRWIMPLTVSVKQGPPRWLFFLVDTGAARTHIPSIELDLLAPRAEPTWPLEVVVYIQKVRLSVKVGDYDIIWYRRSSGEMVPMKRFDEICVLGQDFLKTMGAELTLNYETERGTAKFTL